MRFTTAALLGFLTASPAFAGDFPKFRAQEIDPHVGNVCYAVASADVDGDGKPDVVAVTEDSVVWYRNPTWAKATVIKNATEKDNVCLQAHDIDGDGRIDFALGAAWRPTDTKTGGTLQWLTRTGAEEGRWRVVPITSEPTLHRLRFGDVDGSGKKRLVIAPLHGRGMKAPALNEGAGTRVLVLTVPKDPFQADWPAEVACEDLHTTHNLQLVDFDGDGKDEVLLASWEGVFLLKRDSSARWSKTKLGEGNQTAKPFKGASEIKVGKLANGGRYIATIEPWHGSQVVVYTPPHPSSKKLWTRQVVDEPVQWGHAVWCADVDGDGDEEIIIGQRDKSPQTSRGVSGPGVYIYDPKPGADALKFERHAVDEGGVATEDLIAVDLNGDGRPDIVAGGRATHNVKIYWNEKP